MSRCSTLLSIGIFALASLGVPGAASGLQAPQVDTLGLSLEEAVVRALRDSEEIAAARAAMAQADAQVTQATAGALPQINSNLTYNRAIKTIFDEAKGRAESDWIVRTGAHGYVHPVMVSELLSTS